jgi:hypothetical protein
MPPTPAYKPAYKSDCQNVGARFIAPIFEVVVAQHAARVL